MARDSETIDDFRAALSAAGLDTSDEIIGDGEIHRFNVSGDSRGRENGWYILHLDERPAGRFGSWKTGETHSWVAKQARKLTTTDRKAIEKRLADQAIVIAHAQLEAATRAARIWEDAKPADRAHPYLTDKAISAHGIRQLDDALVIPLRDSARKIWSLQFIHSDGSKKFLAGGKISGCYFSLGKPDNPSDPVLICEGFATGASLHAATSFPVVIAFNAGNLKPVATTIRGKFAEKRIIIAADNDRWTLKPIENPGIHYAREAAAEVAAAVAIPEFHRIETRPTDFNDLARLEGLPRVEEMIQSVATETQLADNSSATKNQLVENTGIEAEVDTGNEFSGVVHFPHWNRQKPLSTLQNVEALLDATGVTARYDVIRKDVDIQIPGMMYLLDTARNDKMTWLISQASLSRLPTDRVPEFVSHIAAQNPYNPVAEWIQSSPWDGVSRLPEFFATIRAANEAQDAAAHRLKETLIRRWMLSAIAAAFRPNGVSAHGVLTLQGAQYLGKTAWFKSLVPDELRDIIADGMLLDPKDKDSVYQVVTKWLVELGEIDATFRRSDIAQLKSFITKDRDILRRPYARSESEFARRTVFFASVNPEDFLADPTGNRRFWIIPCLEINYHHGLPMQQVWAEFYELFKAGESWYLTGQELEQLNAQNKDFESTNAVDDLVAIRLDWQEPRTLWTKRSATEIAQLLGFREPNAAVLRQVAKAVRDHTGLERFRTHGRTLFLVPSPKPNN